MSPEEIKAAINGAEAHRHQAWQAGDAKAAADLAVQIDLLWDAWRHTRRPYHTAEGSTRVKLPGDKIFKRKAVRAGEKLRPLQAYHAKLRARGGTSTSVASNSLRSSP